MPSTALRREDNLSRNVLAPREQATTGLRALARAWPCGVQLILLDRGTAADGAAIPPTRGGQSAADTRATARRSPSACRILSRLASCGLPWVLSIR